METEKTLNAPKKAFSPVKQIGLILTVVLVAAMTLIPAPEALGVVGWRVLAIIAAMVVLWITEPIPIGITALLPIVLCPILGLAGKSANPDTGISAWSGFGNAAAVMVIGMFFLSAALVKWNLHKRIALTIIDAIGANPSTILLGFIVATAVISAFMSNTTCTAMMLPLAVAVLAQMGRDQSSKFAKALILSVPFAASIGGIATTIGSGTNVSAVAMINQMNGIDLGFMDWFMIGGPFSILMIPVLWLIMKLLFQVKSGKMEDGDVIKKAKAELGPIRGGERIMFVYFCLAMLLLIFRKQTIGALFPMVGDENLFMILGFLLFVVPTDLKNGVFLMDIKTARGISWDTFLLIAGGLTMGSMFQNAGIADWLAGQMGFMSGWSNLAIMVFIMLVVAFLSELCSNQIVALAFLPVAYSMAVSLGYNPLFVQFAVALSASFAFMLPSGTPPNALAYSSGYFEIADLAKAGFVVKIASCILFPIVIFTISSALSPLF